MSPTRIPATCTRIRAALQRRSAPSAQTAQTAQTEAKIAPSIRAVSLVSDHGQTSIASPGNRYADAPMSKAMPRR